MGALCVPPTARAQDATSSEGGPDVRKIIEDYCTVMSDDASERRVARQTAALQDLQGKLDERLNQLEQSKQELAELIRQRNELRNLAEKELVDIYAGMDAEAAAAQMEKLDIRLASSVLRKLKPRQASAILDVLKPELAVQIVRFMAIAADKDKQSP